MFVSVERFLRIIINSTHRQRRAKSPPAPSIRRVFELYIFFEKLRQWRHVFAPPSANMSSEFLSQSPRACQCCKTKSQHAYSIKQKQPRKVFVPLYEHGSPELIVIAIASDGEGWCRTNRTVNQDELVSKPSTSVTFKHSRFVMNF